LLPFAIAVGASFRVCFGTALVSQQFQHNCNADTPNDNIPTTNSCGLLLWPSHKAEWDVQTLDTLQQVRHNKPHSLASTAAPADPARKAL
jgi:hypothetical protein